MSWSHGYHADEGYTYGYYAETMPLRLHWVAINHGAWAPLKKFRYLDAGCGQGINLIMAAAAHPEAEFVGLDFMPTHIAHARKLSEACGLRNVEFIEADFVELVNDDLARRKLGQFDYAVCHGISTWISADVRKALFSLVGETLKPGGLFYNSYNTLPGWLSTVPFQHLVLLNQKQNSGKNAIEKAKQVFSVLLDNNALLTQALPGLKGRIQSFEGLDPAYLLQEYNNHHWKPVFITDMLTEMGRVKLDYLASATLTDNYLDSLPSWLSQLIAQQNTIADRLQLQDFGINQSFRRDVYVKGKNPNWKLTGAKAIAKTRFIVNKIKKRPPIEEGFVFETGSIKLTGNFDLCNSCLDQADQANGIRIDEFNIGKETSLYTISKLVSLLFQAGYLMIYNGDAAPSTFINQAITGAVCEGAPYRNFSIPQYGCAIALTEVEMMFAYCRLTGLDESKTIEFVANQLNQLGRALTRDGTPIVDREEAKHMLAEKVGTFMTTWQAINYE